MFCGFEVTSEYSRDIIPSVFKKFSHKERMLFFLSQYNFCMEKSIRIPLELADISENLHSVFKKRINQLLNATCIENLDCRYSKKLINAYKNNEFGISLLESIRPKYPVAKLIEMIYAKDEVGLKLSSEVLFSQYVYNKILTIHSEKNVYFDDEMIILEKNGEKVLAVIPHFKYIVSTKAHLVQADINLAFDKLKSKKLPLVLLVYPRNENFTKHIEVKMCVNKYGTSKLKLVPYSISNQMITRRNKWQ